MSIQSSLDRIHKHIIQNPWLKLFAAILRGWLAVGFILPGLKKVANIPFAPGIPATNPIGRFFEAFFQATEFYLFIGIVQVVAGVLLLFPSTTAIGALIYLPILLNILFITVAMEFTGTWIIVTLMLLANVFLICWEFDKWKLLMPGFHIAVPKTGKRHLGFTGTLTASALSGTTAAGLLFLLINTGQSWTNTLAPLLITLAAALTSVYLLRRYHTRHKHWRG